MEQQREKQMASDHVFLLLEAVAQRGANSMEAQSRSVEGETRQCYSCGLGH